MKSKESYIGGPTGGIPKTVFKLGLTAELIYGQSGQTRLECTTLPNLIEIEDYHESKFHFLAYVENVTLVTFSARNKGWLQDANRKHPDIYPFLLLQASIVYFTQQEYTIEGISAYWDGSSSLRDNYNQYWNYLQSLGRSTFTADDRRAAAQNTKTADMARRLNFPVVDDPKHLTLPMNKKVITTVFRKSTTQ